MTGRDEILGPEPPRAGAFIVTIYGDVVEPRGGSLWMGTLIEICAEIGINESLVRTAVSRLVAKGQLQGERLGRRSFYRLAPHARQEFLDASAVIFAPPGTNPTGWLVALDAAETSASRLSDAGFAKIGTGNWLGPDHGVPVGVEAQWLAAMPREKSDGFRDLATRIWHLPTHAAAYRAVNEKYAYLNKPQEAHPNGQEALSLRLALVHDYRLALLADPRLPRVALPDDWAGYAASTLFADLYHALSAAADSHIAQHCLAPGGYMPKDTEATKHRLAALARRGAVG